MATTRYSRFARCIGDDPGVIEAHLGEIRRVERIHLASFIGRPRSGFVDGSTPVRRTDVPPLVPVRIVVQPDELDDFHVEVGLLADFADAGFAGRLPPFDDTAGQHPVSLVRGVIALEEHYFAVDDDHRIRREYSEVLHIRVTSPAHEAVGVSRRSGIHARGTDLRVKGQKRERATATYATVLVSAAAGS